MKEKKKKRKRERILCERLDWCMWAWIVCSTKRPCHVCFLFCRCFPPNLCLALWLAVAGDDETASSHAVLHYWDGQKPTTKCYTNVNCSVSSGCVNTCTLAKSTLLCDTMLFVFTACCAASKCYNVLQRCKSELPQIWNASLVGLFHRPTVSTEWNMVCFFQQHTFTPTAVLQSQLLPSKKISCP